MSQQHFLETLYTEYQQRFVVDEVLFEQGTGHQHLIIFNNPFFGRVMALDGVIQTTERDEFIYHEMLTHTALIAHGNAKKVLILGGGDGGILRETLKHTQLESVTQVEIDASVIDMCKTYFPKHSDGAYDDPKANIVIADGADFVANCDEQFDVIISDSTDPIGPGAALFSEDFYKMQKRCLKPDGIMVAQNGVPFMQMDELQTTHRRLSPLYQDASFIQVAVPTYFGGIMTLAWASDNGEYRQLSKDLVAERIEAAGLKCRYYNAAVHQAAFALPQYIRDAMA